MFPKIFQKCLQNVVFAKTFNKTFQPVPEPQFEFRLARKLIRIPQTRALIPTCDAPKNTPKILAFKTIKSFQIYQIPIWGSSYQILFNTRYDPVIRMPDPCVPEHTWKRINNERVSTKLSEFPPSIQHIMYQRLSIQTIPVTNTEGNNLAYRD